MKQNAASHLNPAEHALAKRVDAQLMLARTQAWSAINSGTGNVKGLAMQAAALADAFDQLPGDVHLVDPKPVEMIDASGQTSLRTNGQHLICTVRPNAARRFLLTGHMDTVFGPDHPFQEQTWLDDNTLNGPGVADMKGGISVMLAALTAFETSERAGDVGYDVLINSDEETGSLSSNDLIADLAQNKLAALTYEPSALPDGTLAHARGGSGNFSVIFTGKSAHAGRNPQEGRNALIAAATLALRLKDIQHDDLPINPAKIDGGSANNVVPDHAILRFNIRPKTTAAAEEFLLTLKAAVAEIETAQEVQAQLHGGITRPPKPVPEKAQRLFDLVKQAGADLGQNFGWQSSGGVCDGNNIADCGVPIVDTMGVRGGAIHSAQEYLIVPSLAERAALSAVVLHRLSSPNALGPSGPSSGD